MKPSPVVHIDNIHKSFGSAIAVDHLDMTIGAGEFVTLLGPSGCGKSTTLRILGGFETPDRGRIVLDGEDVTAAPPNRRNVNMVFQDYALFPHLTVRRNIAFGLELKKLTRPEIDARIAEVAGFLELEAYIDRYPDQLSGGQRQRVALARVLALDPALLLLDEPLAALDAKLRAQVQLELKSIQRRTGKTFVFVTHDQDEAMTMSDRIVVMNNGRVEQDGTPEELYNHPASRFVAGFIGETNLIEARIISRDHERVALDWQGITLHAMATNGAATAGANVAASLRPESLTMSTERPATDNAIKGHLVDSVFKGSRITAEFRLESAPKQTLRLSLPPDGMPQSRECPVWVGFDAGHLALLESSGTD